MTEVHLAHDRKEKFDPLPPGSKGMVGLLSGEKRAQQATMSMCAPRSAFFGKFDPLLPCSRGMLAILSGKRAQQAPAPHICSCLLFGGRILSAAELPLVPCSSAVL